MTLNFEIGASDATPTPTPAPGRKLLAGQDSQPAGRTLQQTIDPRSYLPVQPVLASAFIPRPRDSFCRLLTFPGVRVLPTVNTVCHWHSADFYNQSSGTYLTGTCSQFQVRSRSARRRHLPC